MRRVGGMVQAAVAVVAVVAVVLSGGAKAWSIDESKIVDYGQARVLEDGFLENWMGNVMEVIQDVTLLEMSIPGTHDTMTYAMSDTVSDNANDLPSWIAWILHEFHDAFGLGDFVKKNAVTQGLNITEQLNNGIRFIDFRVVYSAGPNGTSISPHNWYCLHMVESKQLAMSYLQEIRAWMDAHPQEVIYLWVSRHGSQCQDEFPGVSHDVMQAFYGNITSLFSGLLMNTRQYQLNETTVGTLVKANQRVVLMVSDYGNFTANMSDVSLNACDTIDNKLGDGDAKNTLIAFLEQLGSNDFRRLNDTRHNMVYLHSLAGGQPKSAVVDSAFLQYAPWLDGNKVRHACATQYQIPNMTNWCPAYLQAASQLDNYYYQLGLEMAIQHDLPLPMAIYLDAVAPGGLTRTGVELFPQDTTPTGAGVPTHNTTGYCYVDTLILWSVRNACKLAKQQGRDIAVTCAGLEEMLQQRRALNPYTRWDDGYGRMSNWPDLPPPFNISTSL